MLVKIHNRGSGSGRGPTEYLMGKHDHAGVERYIEPVVLRGDVAHTREMIDSLTFSKRYTSGCLSFSEPNLSMRGLAGKSDKFSHFVCNTMISLN